MQRAIRPSKTKSTLALCGKSVLNAVLFFALFMVGVPLLVHRLLPMPVPLPSLVRNIVSFALISGGLAVWAICLNLFSRRVPRWFPGL